MLLANGQEMWVDDERGRRLFAPGNTAWAAAAEAAQNCCGFRPDDEDEWVSDEPRSCYNCRYRRWETTTFACLKVEIA